MIAKAPTGARLRAVTLLAGLCATLGLADASDAHGARTNVQAHEYALHSRGATIWDALQSVSAACAGNSMGPVYSPVNDGQTFADHSWRWDGFDRGDVILVDGDQYFDADGRVTARENSLTTDPNQLNGLVVSRTDAALRAGPVLRSLIKLKSSSSASHIVTLDSNLGTDGGPEEAVRATSSGDTTFTKRDRWVVSSQAPPLVAYDDPALTHVLYGEGADARPRAIVNRPGPSSGCLTVDFGLRIPPGRTRYLLFFTEMNPQPGGARSRVGRYDDRGLSRPLLKGLSHKTRRRVINWDLG
jgi:hypothetical protein